MTNPYAALDATAQAELVASGEVSPTELTDAAIAAAEATAELNAVIHPRYDRARADAVTAGVSGGRLAGVPIVVKDLDGTLAGEPYHAGSRHLRDARYVADVTSTLFAKLQAEGAVIIGKTNTPELGLVPSTESLAYGPAHNPWDTTRSAGGSSGGSAVAVAAGVVPLGHAGDGGGSIRIPASMCGLVGLKPSRGRVSLGPVETESWGGLVARLAVTRSVRDTALVLDIVSGTEPTDPYGIAAPARPYLAEVGADPGRLRVGWLAATGDGTPTHAEVLGALVDAAATLERLGHHVDEVLDFDAASAESMATLTGHFLTTWPVWTAAALDEFETLTGTAPTADSVEPHTWALAELGRTVSGAAYVAAMDALRAVHGLVEEWFDRGWDLLVTPTIPELPWSLGEMAASLDEGADPMAPVMRSTPVVPFTIPFNISGHPAISLPLARSTGGLPIGIQLVAPMGREDVLIRVASQLEVAMPWADARPAVWAG